MCLSVLTVAYDAINKPSLTDMIGYQLVRYDQKTEKYSPLYRYRPVVTKKQFSKTFYSDDDWIGSFVRNYSYRAGFHIFALLEDAKTLHENTYAASCCPPPLKILRVWGHEVVAIGKNSIWDNGPTYVCKGRTFIEEVEV